MSTASIKALEARSLGTYQEVFMRNDLTGEYLSVFPELGGMLNRLCLKKNERLVEVLDGSYTAEELSTQGIPRFKGSFLYPFPNRIKDGYYEFGGTSYQLPVNFPQEKHAIHGLLLQRSFEVSGVQELPNGILLQLIYKSEGEQGFPFPALIHLEYFLANDGGFTSTVFVENTGIRSMPLGLGWHPYFTLGSSVDTCTLQLPADIAFEVDERMIPNGDENDFHDFRQSQILGSTAFDTGFAVLAQRGHRAETVLEDPAQQLSLTVWQETGLEKFNYLQIYTPPHRQSIAIEPMTCLANAFNNKEGLILLEPGRQIQVSFGAFMS